MTTKIGNYCFHPKEAIGKGATGIVYKGISLTNHTPVAIKAVNLANLRDEPSRSLLQNQKTALKTLKNNNIIKLLDIFNADNFCYIITELCEGGTLKDYIHNKGKLEEKEAMQILSQLLNGCNALTQHCIIHRDLKPANILMKGTQPVIIDFGFCEIIQSHKIIRTFNVGSPSYMAPQAYLRTLYSEKSDSWSVGMILYEMLHGRTLDQGKSIKEFYELVERIPKFVRESIDPIFSFSAMEIIERALQYRPQQRMSMSSMKYMVDLNIVSQQRQKSGGLVLMEAKFPPKSILKKLINNQENLGLPLRQVLSINGSYPQKTNKQSQMRNTIVHQPTRKVQRKVQQNLRQGNINQPSRIIYESTRAPSMGGYSRISFCKPSFGSNNPTMLTTHRESRPNHLMRQITVRYL